MPASLPDTGLHVPPLSIPAQTCIATFSSGGFRTVIAGQSGVGAVVGTLVVGEPVIGDAVYPSMHVVRSVPVNITLSALTTADRGRTARVTTGRTQVTGSVPRAI